MYRIMMEYESIKTGEYIYETSLKEFPCRIKFNDWI